MALNKIQQRNYTFKIKIDVYRRDCALRLLQMSVVVTIFIYFILDNKQFGDNKLQNALFARCYLKLIT